MGSRAMGGSGGGGGGGRVNPMVPSDGNLADQLSFDNLEVNNVVTMVCFATALMENLARINRGECRAV